MSDPEIAALKGDLLASLAVLDARFNELTAVLDDPVRLRAVNKILACMTEHEIRELNRLVKDAHVITGVRWIALVLLDESEAKVVASEERIPSGERSQSYCQMVVAAEKPWLVDDVSKNNIVSRWRSTVDYDVGSYMGVPVFADSKCVGALCAFQPDPHMWTDAEVKTMETFARQVENALSHP